MKIGVNLSILGSDSVGKAIGKAFARYWFDVVFYDRDRTVLNALAAEGYRVSSDLADAIRGSNISFICVSPTVRAGGFDSSELEEVYSRIIEISKVFTHTPAFLLCTTSPMLLPSLFKSSDALAALFEIVIF